MAGMAGTFQWQKRVGAQTCDACGREFVCGLKLDHNGKVVDWACPYCHYDNKVGGAFYAVAINTAARAKRRREAEERRKQ